MLEFNARENILILKAGCVAIGNDLLTYYLLLTEMKNNNENCGSELEVPKRKTSFS